MVCKITQIESIKFARMVQGGKLANLFCSAFLQSLLTNLLNLNIDYKLPILSNKVNENLYFSIKNLGDI